MEETSISDKAQDVIYAGFWVRLGAYILDGLFFSLCFMALSYTPLFDTLTTPLFHFQVYGESVPFLDGSTVLFVTAILFMWTVWGVDVGKYLLNLKIIDAKGNSRLGLWQSVWRFLGYIVSSLSFGLGFIAIGLTKDKRGFHDSIAKTRVVYHSHGFLSSVSNPVLRLFLFGGIMFGVSIWGEWHLPVTQDRIVEWEEVKEQIKSSDFSYNPEDFPEHQRAFFESECYKQLKKQAPYHALNRIDCDLDESVTGIPYLPDAWLPHYKNVYIQGHSKLTDIEGLNALVHAEKIEFDNSREESRKEILWEISPDLNRFKSARYIKITGSVIFDAKNSSFTDKNNSPLKLKINAPVKNVNEFCKGGCPNVQGLEWRVQIIDEKPHTFTVPLFSRVKTLDIAVRNNSYFWGVMSSARTEQPFLGNTESVNIDNIKNLMNVREVNLSFRTTNIDTNGSEEIILPISDILEKFHFISHSGAKSIDLNYFSDAPRLESFVLNLGKDGYVDNINQFCSDVMCSKLKRFRLSLFNNKDILDLKLLHKKAPNLERLSVKSNGQNDLLNICPDGNRLQYISISINSEQDLKPILSCKKLKYIHLHSSDNNGIADEGTLHKLQEREVLISYYFPKDTSCKVIEDYKSKYPELGYWSEASDFMKKNFSKEKLKEYPKWVSPFKTLASCKE